MNPSHFKPGNKFGCAPKAGKGVGRKPMAFLKKKQEWLDELLQAEFDPTQAHPLVARLRELAETSNSSSTLEYIFNQAYGSPKSVVKHEVADDSVFEALGKVLPNHVDQETCVAILNDLYVELGGSDPESEG